MGEVGWNTDTGLGCVIQQGKYTHNLIFSSIVWTISSMLISHISSIHIQNQVYFIHKWVWDSANCIPKENGLINVHDVKPDAAQKDLRLKCFLVRSFFILILFMQFSKQFMNTSLNNQLKYSKCGTVIMQQIPHKWWLSELYHKKVHIKLHWGSCKSSTSKSSTCNRWRHSHVLSFMAYIVFTFHLYLFTACVRFSKINVNDSFKQTRWTVIKLRTPFHVAQ